MCNACSGTCSIAEPLVISFVQDGSFLLVKPNVTSFTGQSKEVGGSDRM